MHFKKCKNSNNKCQRRCRSACCSNWADNPLKDNVSFSTSAASFSPIELNAVAPRSNSSQYTFKVFIKFATSTPTTPRVSASNGHTAVDFLPVLLPNRPPLSVADICCNCDEGILASLAAAYACKSPSEASRNRHTSLLDCSTMELYRRPKCFSASAVYLAACGHFARCCRHCDRLRTNASCSDWARSCNCCSLLELLCLEFLLLVSLFT